MGLLGEIGTLEWTRRTNGILGRGERARFIAAVTLQTGRMTPRLLAARAGRRGSGPDPSDVVPPDTPLTREVVEACATLPPVMLEHSYRSYIYAAALARVDGVEVDAEAVFAGTMLHDIALPEAGSLTDRCFTARGAEIAGEVLERAGAAPAVRDAVAESITLHLNPAVSLAQGAVQHLVHDGVLLDAIGIRAWKLDPAGIDRVRERHARLGFNGAAAEMLRVNARGAPGCRAAALFASGFSLALRLGLYQD